MNDKITKGMQKTIKKIVESSKIGLTELQVMVDLSQVMFNVMSQQYVWKLTFPKGTVCSADFMVQELTAYKNDLDAWALLQSLGSDYMELVKRNMPFTDVFELIGYGNTKLNKALGQFLTPSTVADGSALFFGDDPFLKTGQDIRMADIAGCGAGSLLLGMLRRAMEVMPTRLNHIHMLAVDKDPKMVRLTALQITMACLAHQIPLGSLAIHCCCGLKDYDAYASGDTKHLAYVFTSDTAEHKASIARSYEVETCGDIAQAEGVAA